MKRLAPSVFKIPADKLRCGYYTDRYFLRTRQVLIEDRHFVNVGYQFFPRRDAMICGLDEAIAILKTCAGWYHDQAKVERYYKELKRIQWRLQEASARQRHDEIIRWEQRRTRVRAALNALWRSGWGQIKVYARYDGDRVRKNEPVLAIVGNPHLFVHLETAMLGAISRPTSTATAVSRVVRAARGKQVFFFSARFDHYWLQATDGYAALKAGAFAVSTDANADYWGAESMGTMPHFIIGCYGGDTVEAFLAFDRHTAPSVNRIALVDWENDCIGTTRKILEGLIREKYGIHDVTDRQFVKYAPEFTGPGRGKLWGVRFDTSAQLKDASVREKASFGVCPELVKRARREFDRWGCRRLKLIVSGGFDEDKIRKFEAWRLPVDAYGVGSSLLKFRVDMTADLVEYEGKPCSKIGRKKSNWTRLERVR